MMTSNSKNKIERKINKLYSKSEKLNLKLMMADFNFENTRQILKTCENILPISYNTKNEL